ncbi:hypothetical protein QCA50_006538 [Cerrena zonata]|uniref:Uncharacterized protein n=1 Tax=Cerrena zonata TaxID=2478898 RepID=A0AAW0GF27_9APHY
MKFSTFVLSAAALFAASSMSAPVRRAVDPSLVPAFGIQAGQNPTGTGDCDGVAGPDGKPIKIPCACPPPRDQFLNSLNANVAAGFAVNNPSVKVSFPTDGSAASQIARIQASLVTLQNLNGPGKGCPASSTTLLAQQNAVSANNAAAPAPAPANPVPPPANNAAAGAPSAADVARLAPALGFAAGKNPTGTGDCDGAVNGADGKPIKIPCACPPPQAQYIAALQANVAAGHAINNPSVAVNFPTDDSSASKSARITAALISLQNLNGPGKGCPAVSTTLLAQQKALKRSVRNARSDIDLF